MRNKIIIAAIFLLSPLSAFAATFTTIDDTPSGVNFAGAASGTGQQMNFDFHCEAVTPCNDFFSTLNPGDTYTITGTGNGNDGTYTFQSWSTSGGYGGYGLIDVSETFPSPGSSFAHVTFYHADPPPPPTPNPFIQQIAAATSTFSGTTGFDLSAVMVWAGDNLIKLFIGSGLALLFYLRGWIVAMLVIAAIIYFAYRAFRFFRH